MLLFLLGARKSRVRRAEFFAAVFTLCSCVLLHVSLSVYHSHPPPRGDATRLSQQYSPIARLVGEESCDFVILLLHPEIAVIWGCGIKICDSNFFARILAIFDLHSMAETAFLHCNLSTRFQIAAVSAQIISQRDLALRLDLHNFGTTPTFQT